MATHDKDLEGKLSLSRRDFLKAGAAAAVAGAVGVDFAAAPPSEAAVASGWDNLYTSTCPYCSAQCGQKVAVKDGVVVDVFGDMNSPTSRGGLCSKGAGSYQLVTNVRRLGVPEHTSQVDGFDFTGEAWKRIGNGAWTPMTLDAAMTEIAAGDGVNHQGLVAIRGGVTPGSTAASNSKSVMFFGSSHMNNEPNYLLRKLVAEFGTSNVEHQARI